MRHIFALTLFLVVTQARADSWSSAKVAGLASPSGKFVVRVVPGSNLDAVYGFSGAQKGKAATATYYRLDSMANYEKIQEISLLNPIAPVFAAVTDAGELITLDNWHNMGIGDSVVVVYTSDGKVRRSYRLADIYTEGEIKKNWRKASRLPGGGVHLSPCMSLAQAPLSSSTFLARM